VAAKRVLRIRGSHNIPHRLAERGWQEHLTERQERHGLERPALDLLTDCLLRREIRRVEPLQAQLLQPLVSWPPEPATLGVGVRNG
jgi:hypothetical protein